MFAHGLVLCAIVAVCLAATCPYPNNTDTGIHTYNCDNNHPITILDSKVLDANDQEMYPVNFNAPITIELTAINNGVDYQDNKVDVKLWEYTTGWLSSTCDWKEVPTFGLLNNIDGCDYAKNCPLRTGDLDLRLPLDLSQYSLLIGLLLGDHPYQLSIHMKNYNPGVEVHDEIACTVTQMKITT